MKIHQKTKLPQGDLEVILLRSTMSGLRNTPPPLVIGSVHISHFFADRQEHVVFSPPVKKEIKNSSIEARNDFSKIAIFSVVFLKGNEANLSRS